MMFVPVTQGELSDRCRVLDSGLEGPRGTTMTWDDETLEDRAAPRATD